MMNAQSYVQTRCPSCGNAAWGHPNGPVPCTTCGQPVPAVGAPAPAPMSFAPPAAAAPPGPFAAASPNQPYVPPAAVPAAAPATAATPGVVKVALPYGIKIPLNLGGKHARLKIFGLIFLVIAGAIGFAIYKITKGGNATAKGNLSYSSIGLDMKKADPDKMITAVGNQARKWRKDAVWWGINLQAVKADGTVDLSGGGAMVEYISLGGVQSTSDKTRNDSIKKFSFGPSGVDHGAIWGASEPWEGVVGPSMPKCEIKDVVKLLADQGLTGKKTVRITFDPQFAFDESWHVIGEDPKIDAYYSMADCSPTKP